MAKRTSDDFLPELEGPLGAREGEKEGGFIGSLWHRAIAVNVWRAKIAAVNTNCKCCEERIPKPLTHRFYECRISRRAWNFCFSVIHRMERANRIPRVYQPFSLTHCLFGRPITTRHRALKHVWSFLRGTALGQM